MKRFSMPSIDRDKAARRLAFLCLSLLLGSCVSTPDTGGTETAAGAPAVVDQVAAAPAVIEVEPQAVDSTWRRSPPGLSEEFVLAEPSIMPTAAPASPSVPATEERPPAAPVDITVLSAAAPVSFAPVALPEPAIAPARPAEKAPEVPAEKAPAVPAPVAKAPSAPAPVPKAPAATAPVPKAPAAKPEPKSKEPESPKAAPAKSLGPAPASSARVVDSGTTERRIDQTRAVGKGERFELRFPGSGWIYLGDEDGKEGVRYETRRFEGSEAIFALRPETGGEYVLRFQRQDPLDGSTDSRLVKVTVSTDTAATVPIGVKPVASTAPTAAATTPVPAAATTAVPPAAATTPASTAAATTPVPAVATTAVPTAAATTPASTAAATTPVPAVAATTTVPAAAPATPSPATAPATLDLGAISDPARLLALARSELEAKRTQSALAVLDRYRELFPYGNDELFFLYGLAYEQDTPFRNVKKAHEAYKRVRDEYPRSLRWSEAADRIAFLERHYFGLR